MNKFHRSAICALATSLLLGSAGCSILAPQKDRSQFFILTPTPVAAPSAPATALHSDLSVGLGPVAFPDYLKRQEIVTRVGPNQLKLSEVNRWAEPLDSNFERVLEEDLGKQLGTRRIVKFPWYRGTHVDYEVQVEVHRFDTTFNGQSQLDARWIITDGNGGGELFAADTTLTSSFTGDDAAGSSALSRDINDLSIQIADRIALLEHERATRTSASGLQSRNMDDLTKSTNPTDATTSPH